MHVPDGGPVGAGGGGGGGGGGCMHELSQDRYHGACDSL